MPNPGESSKFTLSLPQRSWNHLCWVHRPGQDVIHTNGSQILLSNTAVEADTTFTRRSEVMDSALILGQTPASSKIRDGFSIRKMFQGNLTSVQI